MYGGKEGGSGVRLGWMESMESEDCSWLCGGRSGGGKGGGCYGWMGW